MIELVTLFLGLVTGPQTVELAVEGPFVQVELRLDGEVVGRAPAPPYRFKVDFGERLEPHRLEAIGYAGEIVVRAEQTVNLPRPPVALRAFLGARREDGSREGRLVWRAVGGAQPSKVEVRLDETPLEVRAFRAFELPPLSGGEDAVHVLEASIELANGTTDTATVLVGGVYGERVNAQLTAVPVRVEPGATLPPIESMKGWLSDGGEPLDVEAVDSKTADNRRAELVVVRGRGSWEALTGLASGFLQGQHRNVGTLGGGRTVRLLDPIPIAADDDRKATAAGFDFPLSQPLSFGSGGLPILLGTFYRDDPRGRRREARRGPPQQIARAVAAAGVTAAGAQAPRAVLLVLGDEVDASDWSPEMVRGYLRALRVPLYVWSPIPPAQRRDPPARLAAWGAVVDVSSEALYLEAIGKLADELGSQRVLWIEGERFLHRLATTPAARGIRLVE